MSMTANTPPNACPCTLPPEEPDRSDVDRLIDELWRVVGDLRLAADAGLCEGGLLTDLHECIGRRLGVDGFPRRRIEGGGLRPLKVPPVDDLFAPPPIPADAASDEPGRAVLRFHAILGSLIPQPAEQARVMAANILSMPEPACYRLECGDDQLPLVGNPVGLREGGKGA